MPKVLGDLFESLIAAIYLDCDRDLNFVWKICYRFLEKEISKLKEYCEYHFNYLKDHTTQNVFFHFSF